MRPHFSMSELRKTTKRQYAQRFLLGAGVSVATGLIAHAFGARVGGLFLAFPVLLPASLTAVNDEDGRAAAANDARGARLGALGLAVFALALRLGSRCWSPAVALLVAFVAWTITSVVLWRVFSRNELSAVAKSQSDG